MDNAEVDADKVNTNAPTDRSCEKEIQIEMGILRDLKIDCDILVVADGWPSWFFALEGFRSKSIKLFMKSSLSVKEEFKAAGDPDCILKEEELEGWFAEHPAGLVLVQGSRAFAEWLHNGFAIEGWNKQITVINDLEYITADGFQVSHSEVGGVTTGKWSVYAERLDLYLDTSFHVRRQLSHILKSTEKASSMIELRKSSTPLLQPNQLLPAGWKQPTVKFPSVFNRNKDVLRLLSKDEIMEAYDLELGSQAALHKYWSSTKSAPTLAFTSQAPLKVLRCILESAFKSVIHLGSNEAVKDLLFPCDASTDTLKHSNLDTNRRITLGDEDTVLTDYTEKAARPDDAEADIEDWDVYSVKSFHPRMTVGRAFQPLVCTGTYDAENHSKLFNALRGLLHRRYRKNVTRSLLKHLRSEYGNKNATIFNSEAFTLRKSHIVDSIDSLKTKGLILECEDEATILSRFNFDDADELTVSVQPWITRRNEGLDLRKSKARMKKKRKKSNVSVQELLKDIEVGSDAVARAAHSTWWDWSAGSTLFFWRWPKRLWKTIRDGTKVFVDKSKLPKYMKHPSWPKDEDQHEKLKAKLTKVRDRKYIRPGYVTSLTGYFAVPKAGTDIRVVYDATKCGLNEAVWAPNFFLPTVDSILRNACSMTWFGDIDLGEMFLNYFLDEEIRPYAGVDVSELEGGNKRIFEQWIRTLMGFRCSPYIATQTFAWGEEIILGDLADENNPFAWDEMKLNLPGSEAYDPTMPWMYKWNSKRKCMPAFFGTYVDDVRTGAWSEDSCRSATRTVASIVNYLGQQDAARKRRPPSKVPGAWAGAMCISVDGLGLFVLSTQGKWDKAKGIIDKWADRLGTDTRVQVNHKEMEQDVGFLCHISRTYPKLFPYLKGFYNTLNTWRFGRDDDGWKITSKTALVELASEDRTRDEEGVLLTEASASKTCNAGKKSQLDGDPPSRVQTVGRFKFDVEAMSTLMSGDTPSLRLIRGERISEVSYGFGDASGGGFGGSWIHGEEIIFRFGVWGSDMDMASSNLREATNDVASLEAMGEQGLLDGVEVFFFTDNSTAEAIFYNGSSKNEALFRLVLRLHKLEMMYSCKIHFIHCSGKRMIAQGTDGLSRGNLTAGVMAGRTMTSFIPIHRNALERCDLLRPWLLSWLGTEAEFLDPIDWSIRGHDIVKEKFESNIDGMKLPVVKSGSFVWSPPPCLAEIAVEELRKARHKRTGSRHLFIVPRLMQPTYFKQLLKAADLVISLPIGHPAWPEDMYEPLTLAFVFPFLNYRPWQLKGAEGLLSLGRELLLMWKENSWTDRHLLWKLWSFERTLLGLPQELASKMLQGNRDEVLHQRTGKRRRSDLEEEEGCRQISRRKKR